MLILNGFKYQNIKCLGYEMMYHLLVEPLGCVFLAIHYLNGCSRRVRTSIACKHQNGVTPQNFIIMNTIKHIHYVDIADDLLTHLDKAAGVYA